MTTPSTEALAQARAELDWRLGPYGEALPDQLAEHLLHERATVIELRREWDELARRARDLEERCDCLHGELATERQRAEAARGEAVALSDDIGAVDDVCTSAGIDDEGLPHVRVQRIVDRLSASEAKRKALREAMCSIWSIGQECKGPDSAEEQRMFDIACEALAADGKDTQA